MRRATPQNVDKTAEEIFLPTLSMRRATGYMGAISINTGISTHALHAESDQEFLNYEYERNISTHALHAESDLGITFAPCIVQPISTHALHAESDHTYDITGLSGNDISTHALHAESDWPCCI